MCAIGSGILCQRPSEIDLRDALAVDLRELTSVCELQRGRSGFHPPNTSISRAVVVGAAAASF